MSDEEDYPIGCAKVIGGRPYLCIGSRIIAMDCIESVELDCSNGKHFTQRVRLVIIQTTNKEHLFDGAEEIEWLRNYFSRTKVTESLK